MLSEGRSGEVRTSTGTLKEIRLGPYAECIVNDAGLGRYFEATRLGRVFHISSTAVAPNGTTYSVGAANVFPATSTPVLALVNLSGSGKAAVIQHGSITINPAAATALAVPVWCTAPNSGAISTAAANTAITSGR